VRLPEINVRMTTMFNDGTEDTEAHLQLLRPLPDERRVELIWLASVPCQGREHKLCACASVARANGYGSDVDEALLPRYEERHAPREKPSLATTNAAASWTSRITSRQGRRSRRSRRC